MSGAGIKRPPVYRITLVQAVVLALISLGAARFDSVMAYSIAAGGLLALLPQAWFAWRLFGRRGAQSAARSGYAAETGKFMLSAVGFAAVFALLRPIHGPGVFLGYIAMLLIQIVGSVLLLKQDGGKN
jgi:ATP synthase protein I